MFMYVCFNVHVCAYDIFKALSRLYQGSIKALLRLSGVCAGYGDLRVCVCWCMCVCVAIFFFLRRFGM